MIRADSICDELSSPLFLTFCPRRGHTLPMGSFLSTISSLCILEFLASPRRSGWHILIYGVESWSGVEPWSGVVFGVVFWSRNVCYLRSEDYMKTT